ncbi:hypothetical protein QR680_003553 [Steinernema hermaphroditum]|uniref:Uncharacterized protein n=1 Tax=Steinernema hermaphroditum TaxID=289476 RepID=A0AA39HLT9_9BILA|nr:hypothetical protein QR680_003553 [Steinernema hermaphroditum]
MLAGHREKADTLRKDSSAHINRWLSLRNVAFLTSIQNTVILHIDMLLLIFVIFNISCATFAYNVWHLFERKKSNSRSYLYDKDRQDTVTHPAEAESVN